MKDAVILLLLVVTVVTLCVCEGSRERKVCFAQSEGKPYTSESVFTKTSDGCTINKVDLFGANCGLDGTVYYTTCPKTLTWNEQHGKFSVKRSNTTKLEGN